MSRITNPGAHLAMPAISAPSRVNIRVRGSSSPYSNKFQCLSARRRHTLADRGVGRRAFGRGVSRVSTPGTDPLASMATSGHDMLSEGTTKIREASSARYATAMFRFPAESRVGSTGGSTARSGAGRTPRPGGPRKGGGPQGAWAGGGASPGLAPHRLPPVGAEGGAGARPGGTPHPPPREGPPGPPLLFRGPPGCRDGSAPADIHARVLERGPGDLDGALAL